MTSLSSAEQQKNTLATSTKSHFFTKEIQYLRHIISIKSIRPLPSKTQAINNMHPPKTAEQVHAFLGLITYYRKFIKNFAKMAKPLTLLICQKAKFEWTPVHHTAFLTLKESVTQAPILCYPDPTKQYIVYTDTSDDVCGAQLSQEYDGMEFPIAFLCILSWPHKGNGVPQNKKLMEYTMQSQNGTIT